MPLHARVSIYTITRLVRDFQHKRSKNTLRDDAEHIRKILLIEGFTRENEKTGNTTKQPRVRQGRQRTDKTEKNSFNHGSYSSSKTKFPDFSSRSHSIPWRIPPHISTPKAHNNFKHWYKVSQRANSTISDDSVPGFLTRFLNKLHVQSEDWQNINYWYKYWHIFSPEMCIPYFSRTNEILWSLLMCRNAVEICKMKQAKLTTSKNMINRRNTISK